MSDNFTAFGIPVEEMGLAADTTGWAERASQTRRNVLWPSGALRTRSELVVPGRVQPGPRRPVPRGRRSYLLSLFCFVAIAFFYPPALYFLLSIFIYCSISWRFCSKLKIMDFHVVVARSRRGGFAPQPRTHLLYILAIETTRRFYNSFRLSK